MGKYINQIKGKSIGTSFVSKCNGLLEAGALVTDNRVFQDNLVCVVDNGFMAAVGYCYDEKEFKAFNEPGDNRPKAWFLLNSAADYVS